ncbi:MAG: Rid family hydrolase [Candidatus Eisenbacteria bacterium]
MNIERWPAGAPARSRTVAHAGLVWTVAHATDPASAPDFPAQITQTLAALDEGLREGGSSRDRVLSVQVMLASLAMKSAFDELWCAWIGPDAAHWPQRACFEGKSAPGLLLEITAVAAREAR